MEEIVIQDKLLTKSNAIAKKIIVPEGIEKIVGHAFYRDEVIEEIILPSTLKFIGKSAFYHCTNLKKITIPEGVKTITEHCFFNCENLQEVILPDKLNKIDTGAFNECMKLTKIYLPPSVKVVGTAAFMLCTHLEDINLENVEEIKQNAFLYTTLKSAVLKDIKSLGEHAFDGLELESLFLNKLPERICNNFIKGGNTNFKFITTNEIWNKLPEYVKVVYNKNFASTLTNKTLDDIIKSGMSLKEANDFIINGEER